MGGEVPGLRGVAEGCGNALAAAVVEGYDAAVGERQLHAALAPFAPDKPFGGPVRLLVKWCFPSDGRHADGEWKTTKPDTDNLDKALKDEMTRLRYWYDDAQVASEISEKFWADVPGVFVKVVAL